MKKRQNITDLNAYLAKGTITIFNLSVIILCLGYLIEIVVYYETFRITYYFNLVSISLTILAFLIYHSKKLNIKISFSIIVYTAVVNALVGTLADPYSTNRIEFFLRDSLFIMIAITLASLVINKIHSPLISGLYLATYLALTLITKNSFLTSSIIIIFMFVIVFSAVVHYFVGIIEKSILMQKEALQILQEQNKNLNEINTILEEKQQQIEEQSEILLVQSEKLKEQSEQLTIKNVELEQLNKTKNKFFSILAHDLKSPFNALVGFSELLDRNYPVLNEEKRKKYIRTLYNTTQKIYGLLENLLQWAMTQSNSSTFSPEIIRLSDVIKNNLEIFHESCMVKKINVIENFDQNCFAFADKNMLDSIVRNLLSNAIKFTPENGEIRIFSTKVNGKIKLDISDTGIGMDDETLANLFQVDKTQNIAGTMGETGTGLGLILCKEFIEKNGGEIWVVSKKNTGSTFSFTLPAANNQD